MYKVQKHLENINNFVLSDVLLSVSGRTKCEVLYIKSCKNALLFFYEQVGKIN
jgi:hypothetical protein